MNKPLLLDVESAGVTRQRAVTAENAVTRDHDRDPIKSRRIAARPRHVVARVAVHKGVFIMAYRTKHRVT